MMGKDPNEKGYQREKRPARAKRGTNNLVSFRPAEQEISAMRERLSASGPPVKELQPWLESGNKLSCGVSQDNGSFYAILRESGPDWQTARAVGAWSSSLEKALTCIWYYLTEVNPDFPEGVEAEAFTTPGW